MGKTIAKIKEQKDVGPLLVLAAGLVLLLLKLVLAGAQQVYLMPDEAPLDDMAMYNAAVSITEGNWLGAYDYITLAKNSFFALWLAALHTLGIPYLAGGQLLWAAASAAAAGAMYPALKRRWGTLVLYAFMLFIPSSTANPAPDGYITRVYRDNIFPALCVLCVAGMAGFALRYERRLSRTVWWLVLAGAGFGACWLCREDGWWLLPFVLCAAGVCLVFVLRGGQSVRAKMARAACLLLPFALCAACVLGWCAQNSTVYGRFVVNDFSSGEFADAYGAMTRIDHEDWNPKVDVPRAVREKLYRHVPAFAQFEPLLEGERLLDKFEADEDENGVMRDYTSGAFYWALRDAADQLGYYDSPDKAKVLWEGLAADINALCDDGTLAAGPRRSSVSPPIRGEYVGPVLGEGLYSLWFCATFQQCSARSLFSTGGNDPVYYEEKLQPMEAFLHDSAVTVTRENSTEPYYNLRQTISFYVLDGIRVVYAVLLPIGFVAALVWQVLAGGRFFRRLAKREQAPGESLLWMVMLGLISCILLRVFMIAYVTVASFNIGTYVMYLASVHPLMLLYAFVGVWMLAPTVLARIKFRLYAKKEVL